MNKELIKKYKAEFDHWLNGGKLLHKDEFGNWENTRDIWDLRTERIKAVVINDEYVEFRKALAEGKIVEAAIGYSTLDGYIWESIEDDKFHIYGTDELRIKPEKPKFKKGDWVIHNGEYKQVTKAVDGYINSLDNQVAVIMKEESLELWKPKPDEWCWFWNFGDMATLEQFKKYHDLNDHLGNYETLTIKLYQHCEPVIGKLPTNIKK